MHNYKKETQNLKLKKYKKIHYPKRKNPNNIIIYIYFLQYKSN